MEPRDTREDITTGELNRLFNAARVSEDDWRKEMRGTLEDIRDSIGIVLTLSQENERELKNINDLLYGKDKRSGIVHDVSVLKTFLTTVKAWAVLLSVIGFAVFSLCVLYVKLYMETAVRQIIKEEIDAVLTDHYEIQSSEENTTTPRS